jgi:hypothetical protein
MMQGFALVLKTMGLDPETLQRQMAEMIGGIVSTFQAECDRIHKRLDVIEAKLDGQQGLKLPAPESLEPPVKTDIM